MSLAILVVEDEAEVRDALVRDLERFAATFAVETADDVEDARTAIADLQHRGDRLALVLADHLLPGRTGVDLLVELDGDAETRPARKVLVTGQAGLEDTVRAVNEADLDHYIAKPWTRDQLESVVSEQLTSYVVDEVDDVLPYVSVLDAERLLGSLRGRAADR